MKAFRLALVASAALALLQPVPTLAASPTTSAQLPVSGVTAGDCLSASSTVPQLADSGIACGSHQLTIQDSTHPGFTLQPSYQAQSFPGILLNTPGQGLVISKTGGAGATGADAADVFINRTANYSGGTNGYVNAALKLETTVSAGVQSFEWPLTSIVDNAGTSADGGNAVGGYLQGIKRSTGATWASTFELIDKTTNPTTSTVGSEIDVNATGSDNNGMRVVADLFCGADSGTGVICGYGERINAKTNTTIGTGLQFNGAFGNGINLSGGSYLSNAIVLGDTNHLAVDSLGTDYLFHSGGVLYYHTSGGNVASISGSGQVAGSSLSTPGSVSAATGTFTGAVSTGALTASSLSVTGAFSPTSVSTTGAISGSTLTSSANITSTGGDVVVPSGHKFIGDGAGNTWLTYSSGAGQWQFGNSVNGTVFYMDGGGNGHFTGGVSTAAETTGSLSAGAITSSSESSSGNGSFANLILPTSGKLCLNGTSCTALMDFSSGLFQLSTGSTGTLSLNASTGVLGIASGAAYGVGYSTGVSCSGAPTASFQVTGGIVTHC